MTEELLANAYIKGASDLLQGKIEGMPKIIVIPDGATIGDMLTAMFPNLREIEMVLENEEGEEFQVNYDLTQDVSFGWDAPYKAESEG